MKLAKALGMWPGAFLPIKQNHPMKEFMLFFIFEDLAALEKANQAEMNGGNGCFSWIEKLEGKYVGGNALRPEGKRVSGKDRVVTDRAGSEIKEMIGGYFLVKAKDLEEVTRSVQEGFWEFDSGATVEIREVMAMES
jgi:hypothetical protein